MHEQRHEVTPDEASQALQAAQVQHLATRHDLNVHAAGTIAWGLIIGAYIGIMSPDYPALEGILVPAIYLILLFIVSWWMKRSARSVPLGTRRITNRGLVGTVILGFAGIITVNALSSLNGRHENPTVLMAVALGVVTALPTVIAGVILLRRRA